MSLQKENIEFQLIINKYIMLIIMIIMKFTDLILFECSYQYINRVDNIELLTEEGIVFSHNKYLYLLDGLSGDIEKISKIEDDFVLVNYSDN